MLSSIFFTVILPLIASARPIELNSYVARLPSTRKYSSKLDRTVTGRIAIDVANVEDAGISTFYLSSDLTATTIATSAALISLPISRCGRPIPLKSIGQQTQAPTFLALGIAATDSSTPSGSLILSPSPQSLFTIECGNIGSIRVFSKDSNSTVWTLNDDGRLAFHTSTPRDTNHVSFRWVKV